MLCTGCFILNGIVGCLHTSCLFWWIYLQFLNNDSIFKFIHKRCETVLINHLILFQGFIHNLTSQFDEKLHNETSILDEKINTFAENFKLLGMNLTEQIQKQELHASKSWVSRIYYYLRFVNPKIDSMQTKCFKRI